MTQIVVARPVVWVFHAALNNSSRVADRGGAGAKNLPFPTPHLRAGHILTRSNTTGLSSAVILTPNPTRLVYALK